MDEKNSRFWDFSEYFARACTVCHGQRRVLCQGVWTRCVCQLRAGVEFRFSQIPVEAQLKYKDWSDFTGEIKSTVNGREETTGVLSDCGLEAKRQCLMYCFGTDQIEAIQSRRQTLKILDHLNDGQNVVIYGGKNTGKTLLATLLNREVAMASYYTSKVIDFRWVQGVSLLQAARWDNEKLPDHELLALASESDFLTIDGMEIIFGGHNTPPDLISLDNLFSTRRRKKRPTFFICSFEFYRRVRHPKHSEEIRRIWGDTLVTIMNDEKNLVVNLQKDADYVG